MKIAQEFVVARPPDVVWEFLQDVPSVAQCLPGAELTGENEDGSYQGRVSVKLGPMTALFEGSAVIESVPKERTATIEGKGIDKRGGSRGQVRVVYRVGPIERSSEVSVEADVTLSGPVAQFGRTGLINEMSKRLIGDFVTCLEAKLEAGSDEESQSIEASEVRGISLFFASLWSWVKGLFRRGSG